MAPHPLAAGMGVAAGRTSARFTPSRKRAEYRQCAEVTTDRPSGDHDGRPAPFRPERISRTAPVPRSSTLIPIW